MTENINYSISDCIKHCCYVRNTNAVSFVPLYRDYSQVLLRIELVVDGSSNVVNRISSVWEKRLMPFTSHWSSHAAWKVRNFPRILPALDSPGKVMDFFTPKLWELLTDAGLAWSLLRS